MPHYKLTYFDIRGVAEPCRLLFAYAGISYEDNRIELGPLSPELKKELNLPWDQIPILEVDGKILSQSRTLMMYLGKKFNLIGKDEWEEAKCNEIVDAFLLDFNQKWAQLFREPNEEKKAVLKKDIVEVITPKFLKNATRVLQENKTGFFVGSSLTVADIYAVHFITHFERAFDVKLTTGFTEIQKLIETVYGLPGIKEWVAKRPDTVY